MYEIVTIVLLAVLGAMFGSFAGAQMWRLRARQLADDVKAGVPVDKAEYSRLKRLTKTQGLQDRSIDLDTGEQLAWYDLIPVISWLMLRGKSRASGKPIGFFELVIELGMMAFFVGSYVFWPLPLDSALSAIQFGLWLAAGVVLGVQFATDYKWQILWTYLSYAVIGIGIAYVAVTVALASDMAAALYSALGSTLILGGLYFVLYAVSRERWVGLGDVFLGIGLGLLLADWKLALIGLFMANFIGTVVVLIGFWTKRVTRRQHVPFGPFFILGAVVAQLWGAQIIELYFSLLLV